MGKSRAMTEIVDALDSMFESPVYAEKLLGSIAIDTGRAVEISPMDDNIPPSPPTSVEVRPFLQALDVQWDDPPTTDHVANTVIEVSPVGGGAVRIANTTLNSGFVGDLEYKDYTVRVKHQDLWGHESDWVNVSGTYKPLETADYAINMLKAQQAGRLQGLIPGISLAVAAGDDFAENTVKQVALAQPDTSNMLPLREVDFEQYGEVGWPPPDTDVNGTAYVEGHIEANSWGWVVKRGGDLKWLAIFREGLGNGHVVPFSKFRQYGTAANVNYIFSMVIDGPNNGTVECFVDARSNPTDGATQIRLETGGTVTLDGAVGEGQRIWVKFTASPTHPYINFGVRLKTPTTGTFYITRLQLEQAGAKIQPSAWTPGVLSTGVIAARAIAAIDLSAATAIFKNGAIDSAKIKNLVADKISTGQISTARLELTNNGKIVAGKTELAPWGIEMGSTGSYTQSSVDRQYKLTDTNWYTSLSFYRGSTHRGLVLRADGVDLKGVISLQATDDSNIYGPGGAILELLGDRTATPEGYGRVRIDRGAFYRGRMSQFSLSNGNSGVVNHAMGYIPSMITMYFNGPTGWTLVPYGKKPNVSANMDIDLDVDHNNLGYVTNVGIQWSYGVELDAGGTAHYVHDVTTQQFKVRNNSGNSETYFGLYT